MQKQFIFIGLFFLASCSDVQSQDHKSNLAEPETPNSINATDEFYRNHVNDSIQSSSLGVVSNGSLKNATILPFHTEHLSYFDQYSYLQGRGFMHSDVAHIINESFLRIKKKQPNRTFYLMECSAEHGGKLDPHRTHQNGMSTDIMSLKLKDGKPNITLDTLGVMHYFLEFNNQGQYIKDTSIVLDFETIASEIIEIDKVAHEQGYKIAKVIFKIELKHFLFESSKGAELKQRGIYFAQNLTPTINAVHDDHFHIDFEKVK